MHILIIGLVEFRKDYKTEINPILCSYKTPVSSASTAVLMLIVQMSKAPEKTRRPCYLNNMIFIIATPLEQKNVCAWCIGFNALDLPITKSLEQEDDCALCMDYSTHVDSLNSEGCEDIVNQLLRYRSSTNGCHNKGVRSETMTTRGVQQIHVQSRTRLHHRASARRRG